MANEMGTVRVVLEGFNGAPGLIQLRFQGGTPGVFDNADATAAIAAVRTWLDAIKGAFQGAISMYVQSDVEVTDWTNGDLVKVATGTGALVVAGSAVAPYLAAEGPLVQWHTSTVVGKRMLRGRTFLVPSGGGALAATGQVLGTLAVAIAAASNALAATAAVTLSVWHRPNPGGTAPAGTVGAVISASCPSKVAVLRSRRD